MFANQFFFVLPVKLPNAFEYEKFITQNGGILLANPNHCIVITSLVVQKRILKHIQSNCKCVSNAYLDDLKYDKSIKMCDYIVYEESVAFSDDRLVFCDFPLDHGQKKELISILEILQKEREFNGETFNSLAYRNAMGGIRASRKSLCEMVESNFKDVAFVGPKIGAIIQEFVDTNMVQEALSIQHTDRFMAITSLTSIWGVGERTALEWYSKGYHTIEAVLNSNVKLSKSAQLGIKYRSDLKDLLSREKVSEIVRSLDEICSWSANNISNTTVGGYRRGKENSGDIDIVLSHDKDDYCETILEQSLNALKKHSVLADVFSISMRLKYRYVTANKQNDSWELDKALTVIYHDGKARQVDLVVCTKEQLPFCLLAWTGSTTFERLIKLHAKKMGYTLSSTCIYNKISKEIYPCSSEAHIFQFLGLPYRPPHLRNA
eukprot:NODE_10_length_47437_cov_0.363429.p9 type:complete len:434 gc:universal NODE_10_length_47437_cov_0.363429:16587-15286(-)